MQMKENIKNQKHIEQEKVLVLAKKLAEFIGDIDEKRYKKIINKS